MTLPAARAAGAPLPNSVCPLCVGPNGCAPAASGSFDSPCWCATATVAPAALARVPYSQRNVSCLCRQCAERAQDGSAPSADRTNPA